MTRKVIACVVIKNDERFIPDLVKSLRGNVDGLIVLANHTSQNTSISHIFDRSCILYDVPLLEFMYDEKTNMSNLRNKLILATRKFGECYILMIDADERINCFGASSLQMAVLEQPVYKVPIHSLHSYVDNDVRFTKSYQPRLFRNIPELYYEGEYHETLNVRNMKGDIPEVKFLNITHLGYDLTEEELLEKGVERIHRILTPTSFKFDPAKALINFADTLDVIGYSFVASEIYQSLLINFDKLPADTRSHIGTKVLAAKRHAIH